MRKNIILEAAVREMQTGVLALGRGGDVFYANPFFLNSFPVKGDARGKPISDIIANAALLKTVEEFGRTMSLASGIIEISEHGRFFKVRCVPLREDGDCGLLVFFQDITEEKRVETIKKDFVANVSHELRTPLASIKGYSETLLDGGMDDEDTLKEFLRIIDRHATRMARLIDDLLILSKLESHQMTMEITHVDIREVIVPTVKSFEKQARDKRITISSRIPEGLPKVMGDRDRLEQVVVNLVDNAIKYTHSGGSVNISASRIEGSVRVDVADTGIGIPAEDIPRIFERFYRVDKARSRELGGTGLGLAIVKHIIQGHGGRMHVESTPGKGSAFSFFLNAVL